MSILSIEKKFAWSFSGFILGILSLILAIIFFYYTEYYNKIDFRITIEEEFNIVELNELLPDLKIIYKDNDIIKGEKNLKVIVYSFENLGKPIFQNYYDQLTPFKVSFENSEILKTEIIKSNSEYLTKNFLKEKKTNEQIQKKIELNKVIFEKGKKITLKSYLIQNNKSERINILVEGKILGIDKLNIIRKSYNSKIEKQNHEILYITLFIFGLTMISSIMSFIKLRKFNFTWQNISIKNPKIDNTSAKRILKNVFSSNNLQKKLIVKIINNGGKISFKDFLDEINPKRKSRFFRKYLSNRINDERFYPIDDAIFNFDEGVQIQKNIEEYIIQYLENSNEIKNKR